MGREKGHCLPIFLFDKAIGIVRGAKAFLNPQGGPERRKERAESLKRASQRKSEQKQKLKSKKRDARKELSQVKKDLRAAKVGAGKAERPEQMKRARKKRQELLKLKSELQAAKGRTADDVPNGSRAPLVANEPETGALPDFVVIGPGRSGTTFFYRLLSEHPHVQPAFKKELHFFDLLFDEGAQWHQRWFPAPVWKDGRWTITGEATPAYIFHPNVPERMAKVIPQARLIALLRNPVDRSYSAYHHRVSTGRESRTFEEVIRADFDDGSLRLLSRSVYVDKLLRWLEFFPREQMLVLKSEDFFDNPQDTLKLVLEFLGLPEWEPEASKLGNERSEGRYDGMDPATRRRLEEYFEPHNRRLYEFLGVDFGW
jgi:hypothetical protein